MRTGLSCVILVVMVFGPFLARQANSASGKQDAEAVQEKAAKKACAMGDYEKGAGPAFDWNGGMHVNSYGPGGNYDWGVQMFDPLKNNDWNYLNYTFTQSIQVDHVSIQLDANKYWVGTMYIDDVIIAGP